MCGIWAFIGKNPDYVKLYNDFMNLKHRGPDMSSFQVFKNCIIGFHRLAIMDPTFHANQPYILEDPSNERTIIFICNGEIYNFKELIKNYNLDIKNNSDCMVIPKLYLLLGEDYFNELFIKEIKGEFAFSIIEFDKFQNIKKVIIGRDQIGIRPLYISYYKEEILISSEIKGMSSYDHRVKEFSPGSIHTIYYDDFGIMEHKIKFYFRTVYNQKQLYTIEDSILFNVKNAVVNSVKRRLVADKPIAFLLSGGVDSSLVAGIAAKLLGSQINTYCCGMEEGTDLFYARQVANHIKSNHTEVFFTPEEGLNAIRDVIYTTETWDTTTVRASIGQYLVCKHIGTKTDARVVLVGEGPDEVCSSYLFNYYAKNGEDLHNCALEYVEKIHLFDGRRADRCISRWGLEGRIALLDPEFIEEYWKIPSEWRMPNYKGLEKWYLRKAFEDSNIICDSVLWRKKEAFSDGVSSKKKSWFEILQDYINKQVSNEEFNRRTCGSPSKEAYYYKKIFIEFFGKDRLNIIPHYWQPKFLSDGSIASFDIYQDPSARVLSVYNKNE